VRAAVPAGVLGALAALYLAVSLHGLGVAPPVYEDEPWQASTGWKLATEGTFGSDLFAGFNGMERRHYWFLPVHPLLLAATFRLAGPGLVQARTETVALGLLTLLLAGALGWRLFGPAVGVLGAALLLLARTTGLTPSQTSGILLVDVARIARYDMAVPVFGLASLHAYLWGRARGGAGWYATAGLLAGLAGLSHLYGAFWLPALAALALWDRAGGRPLAALAGGFAAAWLPYLAYVLADVPTWVSQTRQYGPRFGLLDPHWYWRNLVAEPRRYGPGLGPPGWGWLARPGAWLGLLGAPAAALALAARAWRGADPAARALAAPLVLLPALFALLVHLKLANYLVTVAPLGALAVAWAGVALWRRPGARRGGAALRAALAAALLAVALEGAARLAALSAAARTLTPYAALAARVRPLVPPGARVLAPHRYWFGLEDRDFRSWLVPLGRAGAGPGGPPPDLARALDEVAPDVVLIDGPLRAYLAEGSPGPGAGPVDRWLGQRGYARVATVADPTYGTLEAFRRAR
jgi:hypothetical protein